MKYIKVEWPEIQDYMSNPEYNKECYFDPRKNCWFIPDTWEPDVVLHANLEPLPDEVWLGGDIGDLEDAIG